MDEILNNAPCGYVSFDDTGRIHEINDTLRNLLGLSVDVLREAHIETLLTVASKIFYQTHFFPLLALNNKAEEIYLTLQAKDQTKIPMLAYAVRKNGLSTCILVSVNQREKYEEEILSAKRTAEDAVRSNKELLDAQHQLETRTNQLERRTRKAEQNARELLQVTKILFHDLREPLRRIETFTQLIAGEPDSTLRQEFLERILVASTRIHLLLRSLQHYVSLETTDEQPEQINLEPLIFDGFQKAKEHYSETPANISIAPLPSIQGSMSQLQLLFYELARHAFKFQKKGVELEIKVTGHIIQENNFQFVRGRYRYVDVLQIFFEHNGIAMPEEHQPRAFDLFSNTEDSLSDEGCGLAGCRKITENHYGQISIIPNPSGGTMFKILLPVKQEMPAA